jgi:hypothetical protein
VACRIHCYYRCCGERSCGNKRWQCEAAGTIEQDPGRDRPGDLSDAEFRRHQRERTALLLRCESARGRKAQGGAPVWSRNSNCWKDGQLSHPGVAGPRIVRYFFWAIDGANCGDGQKGSLWSEHAC